MFLLLSECIIVLFECDTVFNFTEICMQLPYVSSRSTFISLQNMSTIVENNPIELSIRKKLIDSLNPSYIKVINESYMHNVPKGSETHFKVIVVSDVFKDKPLLKVRILMFIQKEYNSLKIINFI